MVTERILKADLSKERDNLFISVNQYDNYSRKYRLVITDNGVPRPFTEQKTIRLVMQLQGDAAPYYDGLLSDVWEGGYPVVTFTASMLFKSGIIDFKFYIYEPGSSEIISTRMQHLKVQKGLINYDGIIASEEFETLSDLIAQATTIPTLINDIHTSIEEVNIKISEVNTKMSQYEQQLQTYETTFLDMQTEQQAVIDELHTYMLNVENAVALSAKNSESWAIGGTGTRIGENTNNSKYYSELAKNEADRAEQYAGAVDPKTLSQINAIDTEGLLGTVGDAATGQALIDEIADRVATKLIPYNHLVNNGTTTVSGQYALDGAYGKTLADGLTTVNSNLGGKLIVIESTFKTLANDGKTVITQLEGSAIEALGITPQNSIIVGWSAHNKVSNTWWSNDTYPSINKVVKSNTYNISVTNLPQNGFYNYYISDLPGKNIIGVNVKWTNTSVLMSTIIAKDNNTYINTINPYTSTITDTGIATVYYYEDDDYVGIEPINCVVAKLRINLSTSKTMLQVQSHLPSQYDVGDKFRIVIYKFDNVIEITA